MGNKDYEVKICPTCNGNKIEESNNGFLSWPCRKCGGTGKVKIRVQVTGKGVLIGNDG